MTELIKWRRAWLSGVDHLDDQHRKLAGLVNQLVRECACDETSAMSEDRRRRVAGLLDELYSLTRQHFHDEEALMLTEGFPAYPGHAREHNMLLAEFKMTFLAKLQEACCNMNPQTLSALRSWYVTHIATSDRQFAEWLAGRHPAAGAFPAQHFAD